MLMEAVDEVAATALRALPAVSSEVADTDALADLPVRHPRSEGVDAPDRFMPGNAGKFGVGEQSFDREGVRVADATGFDADPNLTGSWIDERAFLRSPASPASSPARLDNSTWCLSFPFSRLNIIQAASISAIRARAAGSMASPFAVKSV